jgi:hypothetical protein
LRPIPHAPRIVEKQVYPARHEENAVRHIASLLA